MKIIIGFRTTCFIIGILLIMAMLASCKNQTESIYEDYDWIDEIRDDHPRLFFNKNSFKAIKKIALNDEREVFEDMKSRVDELVGQKIGFSDSLILDGNASKDHLIGTRAAEAAFVYLVLGEKKYLDLSKNLLVSIIGYYNFRFNNKLNITWTHFSRINALAAYDWIYNDLSKEERIHIGRSLFHEMYEMVPSDRRKLFFRESANQPTTGFYGTRAIPWYAGIVFYGEGINDDLTIEWLKKGYDDYIELLNFRSNIAGNTGGAPAGALNYAMGAYPWAEFNFFHTFNSATGAKINKAWTYVPYFPYYILWNWLPGDKHFGYGDVDHKSNNLYLSHLHIHLSQIIHFYGETHPELVAFAKGMLSKVEKQKKEAIPVIRFLLTNTHEEIKPKQPADDMGNARYFNNMGQIFMRSGSGPQDTYALFTAGGVINVHRHYDNNNFVIFKRGFLAMDTGTRPQPGLHLSHYYCRTVAHNCITIKMPGEKMPKYWGGPSLNEENLPIPNDGGQNNFLGSEVIAFEENEQYVYIASDATEAYHQDKAELVQRQFVFLPPDHFVIFDKVTSTNPEYQKRWLLHTATEPVINNVGFYADHWEGRLFCKTLFPDNVEVSKIGGPGKQFWSDGTNWPMPVLTTDDWKITEDYKILPDTLDLLGQWRIEVTPSKAVKDDVFLHLIQVGDTSLKEMVSSETIRSENMVGVRFISGDKKYKVMFMTDHNVGGTITVAENGQTVLEEIFTDQVQIQKRVF